MTPREHVEALVTTQEDAPARNSVWIGLACVADDVHTAAAALALADEVRREIEATIETAVRDARTVQATEFTEMCEQRAAMWRGASFRTLDSMAATVFENKAVAMDETAEEIRKRAGLPPPTKERESR